MPMRLQSIAIAADSGRRSDHRSSSKVIPLYTAKESILHRMDTISKDFLESLSDDERADFINTVASFFSMSPSEQDELLEKKIQEMYAGCELGSMTTRCSFCRKVEPDEIDFGECAGCGAVKYCSKECQISDWKRGHKAECRKCESGSEADANSRIFSRIQEFRKVYAPFVNNLVLDMYRLYNKKLNAGEVLFPEDCIVDIELADLPREMKRPRLYIKRLMIGNVMEHEKEAISSRFRITKKELECAVRFCFTYKKGENRDDVAVHNQFIYKVDQEQLDKLKRSSEQMYDEFVSEHITEINRIARGERPDVYKVIKKIMKERAR